MKTEHIEKFIEDAIAGGWRINPNISYRVSGEGIWCAKDSKGEMDSLMPIQELLLRPDVWQAVSKVRNWEKGRHTPEVIFGFKMQAIDVWQYKMHNFIDHLAEGKTINTALEAINNSN